MVERTIKDAADLDQWVKLLESYGYPITVSAVKGKDRTSAQNNLMWKWATETAHQLGDNTVAEVQARWKRDHGVPILQSEDPVFRGFWHKAMRGLTYEQQVKAMAYVPVTSTMKVKQMVAFMDAVERECLEQGVVLTQPDDDLAAYNDRYRRKEAA